MITESHYRDHIIKCSLCNHEIKERATVYPTGLEVKVVCIDCYRRFSEEDLELIANLLRAFGGYFGQYKRGEISIKKILKAIHKDLLSVNKNLEATQINIKMLHKALLHGITPREYIDNLELIFED